MIGLSIPLACHLPSAPACFSQYLLQTVEVKTFARMGSVFFGHGYILKLMVVLMLEEWVESRSLLFFDEMLAMMVQEVLVMITFFQLALI